MPNIPESVIKEQYLLKSTFFYNKLKSNGYFKLFAKVRKLAKIEGEKLCWDNRADWNIGADAWNILQKNSISPMLAFVHPKVLKLNPEFLKYYRSVAMIPQKGFKTLAHVSNIEAIESGRLDSNKLSNETITRLVRTINEVVSLVVQLALGINEREIEGMMFATAGTNIDGSWRNQIGTEGERVIRNIILNGLLANKEVTSLVDKSNDVTEIDKADFLLENIEAIKTVNLVNGYSVYFSSEPDVTMYDSNGNIVGIIEIKSGLDPAGALERLGAMFKSFENTLAEYPNATTILVASCITDEMENRLSTSMTVRQKYITANITSRDSEKKKFVNRLRVIMKLA